MGAELPPWPHAAAETETRVRICEKETISGIKKPSGQNRSVRIHGNLILSHGTRRVGPRSSSVDVTHQVDVELDHRAEAEDFRPDAFTCIENCSDLIQDMLAKAPATREYDLAAAGNWVDSARTPLDIATAIVQQVRHEYDDVPVDLELDVHLLELRVTLAYSEPKALLLACKEAAAKEIEATGASACGRKRRREPGGELCPICLLDAEIEEEETVRLPCSHSFHGRCIETWFDGASTCPTCRRDIMDYFSFVRAAPPEQSIDENEIATMWDLFGDEPEDELGDETLLDDQAEGEQSIASELQFSDEEFGDETLLDDVADGEQSVASELQLFGDESGDEELLDDIAEGKQSIASELQLFGDESKGELFPDDIAEGEQSIASEIQLVRAESGDGALLDDVAKAEQSELQLFGGKSEDKMSLDVDIDKGEQLYVPKYNCLVTNPKMNRS